MHGTPTWEGVTAMAPLHLNGSAFAFIDDDAAGSSAPAVDAALTSPVIYGMGYDTLTVEFDHYYRHISGTDWYVEVYRRTNWVTIDTMNATRGSWTAPAHEMYECHDVSESMTSKFVSATAMVQAMGLVLGCGQLLC